MTTTVPAPVTVVVGSDGFIGANLCRALDRRNLSPRRVPRPRNAADDHRFVDTISQSDLVFYAASTITPSKACGQPELVEVDQRALGTALEACKLGARRPTFVLLGSGGTAYRPDAPPPLAESSPLGPDSVYGQAKLAQERALWEADDHVRPVVLRLSNVYGPGQRARGGLGVVSYWLEAASAQRPLQVFGDLATRRDYVYIDDVVSALLAVRERHLDRDTREALDGAVLNVGAGRPTSLAELLEVVTAAIGRPPTVEFSERRTFDRRDIWLDVRRASALLGWRPTTDLRSGVARTWAALAGAGA
ncbi:UDP-glucose 4-epimerase [Micromonospora phaseoli]|uniref:UDP-glucose 4-epimerase n=1 Tax=Micromonospora phaseoli TaxID=1144548 RepID=A0A1H7C1I1_9ACTN|nr:NAD-dependent epimerase/dehydratase family protein [Micromonospora phaseoli]PZV92691.1 UDP-glucose 4-epimerase [Micromonospora phaseoli]GIJ76655.1 UDP-glucose 4-epimerase [Micromonospora phaseoli]SEJ83316.1 UDP-glucose 4-epimerase [Micromonospora phaseoli]